MQNSRPAPLIAIACGGTGGHLFPGLAVAGELIARGGEVTLLISPKDVDQQAVKNASGLEIVTLPAVALTGGNVPGFVRGFWNSFRAAKKLFNRRPPQAVLAMGGFTSAPPVLAGKVCGAATFLHESNTIPGKANRWLSYFVDRAFVGFPSAGGRLHTGRFVVTGTPVRPQFRPGPATPARAALGLDPARPVLLITGGSQGAAGINDLVTGALPELKRQLPELQFLHLTGLNDVEKVRAAHAAAGVRAVVRPFLAEMELALTAATLAVSRAGASSLAELAAVRLPAILIPYPSAADDHQFHNARAFVQTGAARMIGQRVATTENFTQLVVELMQQEGERSRISHALAQWHSPDAAAHIAETILQTIPGRQPGGRAEKAAASLPPLNLELQTSSVKS